MSMRRERDREVDKCERRDVRDGEKEKGTRWRNVL